MTDDDQHWDAGTWEGAGRAQRERYLRMTESERQAESEQLEEVSRWVRAAGERAGLGMRRGPDQIEDERSTFQAGCNEIELSGCTPVPLGSYLKALGILRLVAEQADPEARGFWRGNCFVLQSRLDEAALLRFFAEDYEPTPILAPWNGGSGFYHQEQKLKEKDPETGKRIKTGKRNQPTEATRALDAILSSSASRLVRYRECILVAKELVQEYGFLEAPKEDDKQTLMQSLRAVLPDSTLPVMDAALVLDGLKPKFAPILGSGWNDGNFDFSNNFMQRLNEVFDHESGQMLPTASRNLAAAIFGLASADLTDSTIGQFIPGAAGGPNASSGFTRKSQLNPWDFILLLEGVLLFAATVTRRHMSSREGQLSYPFTVRITGSGSGSCAVVDEPSKRAYEIWMPLWERPQSLPELRSLLGEGRVTLGGKLARDGLDFARALAALGVDRGIKAFQRYGFMERSGNAYLATPLNRVLVRRNAQAALIDQLERNDFLQRFRAFARSDGATAEVKRLVRQLEDAAFEMSASGQSAEMRPRVVQELLQILGDILCCLAVSKKAREACPRLPWLDIEWVGAADDRSTEFRVAAALVGSGSRHLSMIRHLLPVERSDPTRLAEEDANVVWGRGHLIGNLARVLARRLFVEKQSPGESYEGHPRVDSDAVAKFLKGETDDVRISRLTCGLSLVRELPRHLPWEANERPLPVAFTVIKLLFAPLNQLRRIGVLDVGQALPLPTSIPRLLMANRGQAALEVALHRLAASRVVANQRGVSAEGMDGQRLLAALMLPLSDATMGSLCDKLGIKRHPGVALRPADLSITEEPETEI